MGAVIPIIGISGVSVTLQIGEVHGEGGNGYQGSVRKGTLPWHPPSALSPEPSKGNQSPTELSGMGIHREFTEHSVSGMLWDPQPQQSPVPGVRGMFVPLSDHFPYQ